MNLTKKEGFETTNYPLKWTQQKASKIAGSMFLFLIILYYTELLITSHIGSEIAKRITELSFEIIYLASTLLLAYSLYQSLKPFNKKLAQIAMFWRLGESFTIFIMMLFNFEGKAYTVGFNISSILFSIGSFIFFYLFFKSKYIPSIISVFGMFASVMVTVVSFTTLIFPGHSGVIQLGWIPIFIAEITLAFWLLFKGLKLYELPKLNLINQ